MNSFTNISENQIWPQTEEISNWSRVRGKTSASGKRDETTEGWEKGEWGGGRGGQEQTYNTTAVGTTPSVVSQIITEGLLS